VIARDKILYDPAEIKGVEISGIREFDQNGLQNQQVRMTAVDQARKAGERAVLEELDKKLQDLLPAYNNRFFNEAEKRMKANNVDEAVEAYLCHWAYFRGKLPDAQMARVVAIVRQETGLDLSVDGDKVLEYIDVATQALGQ